jgi:surfeit locus 1 family protein
VARRPLLTAKWLVGHALAITVVVSFTQFGFWQLHRHEQRAARNAVAEARLAAVPAPLDAAVADAVAAVESGTPPRDAFHARRVVVRGTFEPADEVLRRPVSRDGTPGYHVVTPLAIAGDPAGRRVWVERGWVPQELGDVPVVAAPPPPGAVAVVGWLRAPDVPPTGWVASLAPRDPPEGRLATVAYVDVARLADQVAGPTVPAVLLLESVAPPSPATLPLAPEPPQVGFGSHLGYAIQWFAFAAITAIGYPALLRRVRADPG